MRSKEEIFAKLIEKATYLYEGNIPEVIRNALRRKITELATALELGERYPEGVSPVTKGTPEDSIRKWILGEPEEVKKDAEYLLENLIEIHPVETYPITKNRLERKKRRKKGVEEG